MRIVLVTALAALALSGCSREDAAKSSAYGEAREPRRPDAAPTAPATTPAATAREIPAPFRGVWDYVKGSCDPASDLRIEIGAKAIEFYESYGTVTAVRDVTNDSVVIDLAMEGEGETWTVSTRYVLSDGGTTLTPIAVNEPKRQAMPLRRCPAGSAA